MLDPDATEFIPNVSVASGSNEVSEDPWRSVIQSTPTTTASVPPSLKREKLIAAAEQVSAATAQLLVACKVKADPDSLTMKRLEATGNAVRCATDELVKAAQGAIERNEEEGLDLKSRGTDSETVQSG